MTTGGRLPAIDALTGIRAFAAGWVVLYHFRADMQLLAPPLERISWLLDAGYAGVDIFFVLSGFIISYTYMGRFTRLRPGPWGRFLWLRLARLYPVHLFTLLVFALIIVPGRWTDARPGDVISNLAGLEAVKQYLLVHAWEPDGNHAWNYPAWSISNEWAAYLAFPLVAVVLVRMRGVVAPSAGFVASVLFNIVTFIVIARAGYQGEILLVRIVGEFLAGCFLFLLFRDGAVSRLPWRALTPVLVAGSIAVTVLVAREHEVAPVVATPLYGLAILGLAHQRDILSRILGWEGLVYLGEASYSLYMTHAIVQRFTWEFLPAGDFVTDAAIVRLAILLLWAFLLLAAAIATFELIERPARDAMRDLLPSRPPPAVPREYVRGPRAPWLAGMQPGDADEPVHAPGTTYGPWNVP